MASIKSTLVALLAVLALGACAQGGTSSRPTGVTYERVAGTQKPAAQQQASQPAATATPAQSAGNPASAELPGAPAGEAQIDTGTFPTSKAKPVGKPWTVMHPSGFTGDYQVAGKLMGLTPAQVKKYSDLHSAGTCKVMDAPNGIVLDRLTFTRDGKHHVQASVKVDLENPLTRKAEVCDLGDGVIAIRFHGCNNHALVRGWVPPVKVAQAAPPVAPSGACTTPTYLRVRIWDAKAADQPGVRSAILAEDNSRDPLSLGLLSRKFGDSFLAQERAGAFKLDISPETVKIVHVSGGKIVEVLHDGPVGGMFTKHLPSSFKDGDTIHMVPANKGAFQYPRVGRAVVSAKSEYVACITTTHFIRSAK